MRTLGLPGVTILTECDAESTYATNGRPEWSNARPTDEALEPPGAWR